MTCDKKGNLVKKLINKYGDVGLKNVGEFENRKEQWNSSTNLVERVIY